MRWTVRIVLLLAAAAALLPALSRTRWPVVVPGLSPLVAIAAIVWPPGR